MKTIVTTSVVLFLAGALTVLSGMYYYETQTSRAVLERARAVIARQQESYYQGNRLLYGTVTAVDPARNGLTATFDQEFIVSTHPITVELLVATDAYIAQQNLVEIDGVNVGLSEPAASTLADIQVGDNIAVVAYYRQDIGRTVAVSILYGNPL